MTQNQLNRAVARATGENIGTIHHLGFSIADPEQVRFDPEPLNPGDVRAIEDRIIDWDWHERRRNVPVVPQRSRRALLV
jgi:hypothetical protein